MTVRVHLVMTNRKLTPRQMGIINAPTAVLYATAAAAGQPISKTLSCRWYNSLMALSGPPKLVVSRAVTMPKPTKPTPTYRPDFRERPKERPMQRPIMVKRIGIITLAPKLMI